MAAEELLPDEDIVGRAEERTLMAANVHQTGRDVVSGKGCPFGQSTRRIVTVTLAAIGLILTAILAIGASTKADVSALQVRLQESTEAIDGEAEENAQMIARLDERWRAIEGDLTEIKALLRRRNPIGGDP